MSYMTGTKYELYRVPLLMRTFSGMKFKDICVILYAKMSLMLIGLEVKVGNRIKVFLNPSDYILGETDHHCYIINH